MKTLPTLLLLALPAIAAVSGTVVNRTTGQPAAGVTVVLNSMGTNGFEPAAETKSDAQGRFTIDHEVQGPRMVRIIFEGVSYFQVLPPGSPSTDLALEVYNSSKQPGAAKVSKHLLAFTPTAQGDLTIQETYLFTNDGKTAWNDPQGELRFYLPPAAHGKVEVNATAPGGMAVPASLVKTSSPDVLAVDFAIKPGETSFDVTYSVPYTAGAPYQGKVVTKDDNTYLIAPQGVTLVGEGLQDLGTYPRTQAHIFGLPGNTYKITLTGAAVAPAEPEAAAPDEQDSSQKISAILPRIYGNIKVILGLALAILAVGFTLLYRKSSDLPLPSKEPNGRGRR